MIKRLFFLIMLLNIGAYAFVVTVAELLDKVYLESRMLYKLSKIEFAKVLLENPYEVKAFSSLPKFQRLKLYIGISNIPKTKQLYYLRKFSELEDGDKLLINAVRNNRNLDDVYKAAKATLRKTTGRRRITNIEKGLMTSKNPRKDYLFGRSIVKRDIFECSRSNIDLMLKGLAPIGTDGKKVNLHHLKQQKNGALIELTQTEHTQHSAVLHRYVRKGSEITDRNKDFQIFKKQYWKTRAVDCIARH